MSRVSVRIPDGRDAEFHLMFSQWLVSEPVTPPPAAVLPPVDLAQWAEDESDLFKSVWDRYSDQAKKFHLLLAENLVLHFDGVYTAAEVAEHLGLADAYAVAGVLAWPGRHCYAVGRSLSIAWTDGGLYSLSDAVRALVLKVSGQDG